jgi:hypothetical protein
MSLRKRVEAALDLVPLKDGAIIVGEDLQVLAERDPMPGAGCVLVVLGSQPRMGGTKTDPGPGLGNLPASDWRALERRMQADD